MRLGAHMSISGGKHLALISGKEIGCETIQVFIRSVRSWSSKPLEQKDIDSFLEKKEEIDEYLRTKFPPVLIDDYSKYSEEIKNVINLILKIEKDSEEGKFTNFPSSESFSIFKIRLIIFLKLKKIQKRESLLTFLT